MDIDLEELIVGELTLPFTLSIPRVPPQGPYQEDFPWDVDILHEFMPLVDDLAVCYDLEHDILVMLEEQ